MDVIRTVLSLLLVLGMMAAAYVWLKRRGNMSSSSDRRMRIVERLSIDAKRSILLLEVDGEEIVVGMGNDSFAPIKPLQKEGGDHA